MFLVFGHTCFDHAFVGFSFLVFGIHQFVFMAMVFV